MSDGEKLIWAAAFASCLAGMDRTDESSTRIAAGFATDAVAAVRALSEDSITEGMATTEEEAFDGRVVDSAQAVALWQFKKAGWS